MRWKWRISDGKPSGYLQAEVCFSNIFPLRLFPGNLFSSPEPKAQWWAYSKGRPLSSVCLYAVNIFKHLLLWNHLGDWSLISYGASFGIGERKFVQMVLVTWPRWPPCPFTVKTLKETLLLRNQMADDLETWNLTCSIRCSSTTNFIQMKTLGWSWPILRQGQICPLRTDHLNFWTGG